MCVCVCVLGGGRGRLYCEGVLLNVELPEGGVIATAA